MSALSRTLPRTSLPQPRGRGVFARIDAAFRLWRQRAELAELDPHLKRDLALSEVDIARERRRPIWNAPGWWS